ncbi:MAG: hypothetical protein MJZ60_05370 [Bacteroidaceae bacterium]|nr:hypothetical protein [Bacteroidaceae bacterium]
MDTHKRLTDIDSLIQTNADSARNMLKQMSADISEDNMDDMAYYTLLCAKADDKAGIKLSNDSAMEKAINYLSENDRNKHLVETYYYAGKTELSTKNTEKALYYLQLALMCDTTQLTNSLQSNIYLLTGNIYQHNYMREEAKSMYELAIYFSQQDGNALNMQKCKEAIKQIEEANDTIEKDKSTKMVEKVRYINQRVNTYLLQRENKNLQNEEKTDLSWLAPLMLALLSCIIPMIVKNRKTKSSTVEESNEQNKEAEHSKPNTRHFFDKDVNELINSRLASNKVLGTNDWKLIDERLNKAYPNLRDTLFSLYNMSETEYRICMLIKTEINPSNIAQLMAMTKSSISQSRLRMQQKTFNGEGTAKDWDKYILSINPPTT